jgi:hypothetical protein
MFRICSTALAFDRRDLEGRLRRPGGYIAGRAFGWPTFKLPGLKLSKIGDGLVAVGVTLVSYGATGLAHGYGFVVAVFIAAMTLRATDRGHDFHSVMAEFSEQIERVLMVIVLVIFGGAIAPAAGRALIAFFGIGNLLLHGLRHEPRPL